MGSCGVSKRSSNGALISEPDVVRKITINPSQFVAQNRNRFSQFYKIGKRLGGGIVFSIIK